MQPNEADLDILDAFADEATRQGRSLACLIQAITAGEKCLAMEGEANG